MHYIQFSDKIGLQIIHTINFSTSELCAPIINGNRDVKFLIGIIGHCTDERNLI